VYTCPNNSCKKTFDKPLKTLNLQQDPAKSYAACPYCLTKIEELETNKPVKTKIEHLSKKESKPKEKTNTCQYFFGYLSQREKKADFPEECMICTQIVDCMLNKNDEKE